MALTQVHEENPVLTIEDVESTLNSSSFLDLFNLGTFERAEVFQRLIDSGARVKMRSTGSEDISFAMERGTRGEVDTHIIPSKGKPAKAFPVRAAIYVAANRDYPVFGGASWKTEKSADGFTNVIPVPERAGLIEFELVRE